jgi:hypothetical protein
MPTTASSRRGPGERRGAGNALRTLRLPALAPGCQGLGSRGLPDGRCSHPLRDHEARRGASDRGIPGDVRPASRHRPLRGHRRPVADGEGGQGVFAHWMLRTTLACQEITGNEVPIDPVLEPRPGDAPLYLSDCAALFEHTQRRPQRAPTESCATFMSGSSPTMSGSPERSGSAEPPAARGLVSRGRSRPQVPRRAKAPERGEWRSRLLCPRARGRSSLRRWRRG